MSKTTDTSVFTVQTALARLSREGLIQRKRRVGTFVSGSTVQLTCVGLYFGGDVWRNPEMASAQMLHEEIRKQFVASGVAVKPWIDDRMEADQIVVLPSLRKAIERREIQALIPVLINQVDIEWIRKLPIPFAVTTARTDVNNRASYDWAQMMRVSLEKLRAQGCRTVGLISTIHLEKHDDPAKNNGASDFYAPFIDLVRDMGMETSNDWIRSGNFLSDTKVNFGYEQFQTLWDQSRRPEGLIVYPDVAAKGVLTAILARRIDVPRELKLVLHLNDRIFYPCPVPASFVTTRLDLVAASLLQMIRQQLQGLPVHPILHPFEIRDHQDQAIP